MNTLAMWSRLIPRLGIGRVLAENLQPFAVIATGQNIENITGIKNPGGETRVQTDETWLGQLSIFPFPLLRSW